ncbi:tyrosine-type recombinase/integrase [bacterium]|jgi:integrase/recombinase XerD|nr:tyrosine-type recombinase/integrase [bacterium]
MKRFLEEYCRYLAIEKGLSSNTVDSYKRDLNLYFSLYSDISESSISSYYFDLEKALYASSSIARYVTSLKMYYLYLKEESLIDFDLSGSFMTIKKAKKLPLVLKELEFKELIQSISDEDLFCLRDKALIWVLYSGGLRVSEVINLKLSHIVGRDFIRIIGKGSKERVVPMSTIAFGFLSEYIKSQRQMMVRRTNPEFVFLSRSGKPLSRQAVFQLLRKYGKRIGVLISPHILRHSIATHLLNKSGDIRGVQEFLGHSDIKSTQVYTNLSLDKDRENYLKSHPRS